MKERTGMSSEIGKKIRCDRCGAECFLKLRETQKLDGGYTTVNKFEDKPDGWGYVQDWNDEGYVDLCPDCNRKYTKMIQDFMGVIKCTAKHL